MINADRLPGQPVATVAMLEDAVHGRSAVDSGWWDELSGLRVDVLTGRDGTVLGAVSYATNPRYGAGVVLWLHGRENRDTVTELLDHALRQLAGCPVVEAFSFATALGLGMEALPVRHRPVTDRALRAAGFVAEDLWRYMHRPLPASGLPRATTIERSVPDGRTRALTVRDRGRVLAEATVGVPTSGIGELWWISVDPDARRRGLGRALLGSALDVLAELGAVEAVLYVDDDAGPGDERNRTGANHLYDSAGFTEIDRLHSYRLAP